MKLPSTGVRCPLPGEAAALLADFTGYLRQERALASTTIENHLNQVRPSVAWHVQHRATSPTTLTIHDVQEFLTFRARSCSAGSISVAATALRALLRWMFLDGRRDQHLVEAIGPVRYCRQAGIPKALPAAELAS